MIRLFLIFCAFCLMVYVLRRYRQEQRQKDIEQMTPDELVSAVIRREISILEVPKAHRKTVNRLLHEIQQELDRS